MRGLFGDFDITTITEKTGGINAMIIMLFYLFTAVFILLSMFLTILGEAQAAWREEEALKDKPAQHATNTGLSLASVTEGLRGMTSHMARGAAAPEGDLVERKMKPAKRPVSAPKAQVCL